MIFFYVKFRQKNTIFKSKQVYMIEAWKIKIFKWFLKCHKISDDSLKYLAMLRGGGGGARPFLGGHGLAHTI